MSPAIAFAMSPQPISTGCSRSGCANTCASGRPRMWEFRARWMTRAGRLAESLGLPHRVEQASDPFFGRGGKLMAMSQLEQSLKFELLIPVRQGENPTACMSFNYHRDHFGSAWGLRSASEGTAHTGCVAFGVDRLALALFAVHGLDIPAWPWSAREALSL